MKLFQLALRAFLACTALSAQVPIDVNKLMQRANQVGWVYGTAREPGDSYYVEHWVLHPEYVYPGPKSMQSLQVSPKPGEFQSEQDFLSRVPFPKGSKYVRCTVEEFNSLPAVQR